MAGAHFVEPKIAEIQTAGGIQGAHLLDESAILDAILEYNPSLAKACLAAGLRLYLHRLAGYEVKVEPLSPAQQLVVQAQQLVVQAQALLAIEQKQAELEAKLILEARRTTEIEELVHQHEGEIDRIFNPNGHYFSVMGYLNRPGAAKRAIGIKEAAKIGRQCTKYCNDNGIGIEHLTDPRFGQVGTYPEAVLARFV